MKLPYLLLIVLPLLLLTHCSKIEERLDFLNEHLKNFNSPLMAMQKKDGTIGLFARKKLKKNTPLLEIPESMTLSCFDDFPRSYFFYEMGQKQQINMFAGHLLFTKYFEKGSWNHNYFVNGFPQEGLKDTAGYWSSEDYKFFQSHHGYYAEHDFDLEKYTRKLKEIIYNNKDHLASYNPKFPEQMFELDELRWAYAMISKYSIPMNRWQWFELHGLDKTKWRRKVPGLGDDPNIDYSENIPGFVLIPFLDLISYESIPFKGKYRLADVFAVDNPEVENQLQAMGIYEPKTAEIEIKGEGFEDDKFFDLLYFDNPGLNELNNLIRFSHRKFTLLANKNYQKGEEIRYLKNKYSNHDLLVNSGELVGQNYFDAQHFIANFQQFQEEHFKFCYEIDCAPDNTTAFLYRFHRFQANHRFIKYLRILVMVEDKLRGEGETPNPFDLEAARRVIARGYFNSPFRELLVWKYYFLAVGFKFNVQRTSIVQDREALKKLEDQEENEIKRKILINGIQEKEIAHRHVQFALQKWSKVMLEKLLLDQIKMQVLGMVEKLDRSQPGFFTFSPLE